MILSGMLVSVWILNTYTEEEQKLVMANWQKKLNSEAKSSKINSPTQKKLRKNEV